MDSSDRTANIVGAGIGGLAAAVALKRAGWTVRVYEREARPRELGFALLLAPNAMAVLRELGLAEAIVSAGFTGRLAELRRIDGRILRRFDASSVGAQLGEPTMVALRQVLHGALLDAVGSDSLCLGNPAVGFEPGDGFATLRLADGSTHRSRMLVGADGFGSVIRQALHPTEAAPRQSGLVAIRGLAYGVGHLLGELSGAQYFGRGVEAGLARANQDVVYWFLSLSPSVVAGKSTVPLELVDEVTRLSHAPLRQIATSTKVEDLRRDLLADREPIDRWGSGAVTLLGDAAHPMLPHAGQGAAQALEDAQALAHALQHHRTPEQALRAYEQLRAKRTAAVVRLARRNARVGAITSPLGCWLRDTAVQWVPQRAILKQMIALGRPPPPITSAGE